MDSWAYEDQTAYYIILLKNIIMTFRNIRDIITNTSVGTLIKIFPFTGVGLGNFKIAYNFYFGEEMMHAHNIYLNTGAELGIPGLIMLIILSLQIIGLGIIYAKHKENKFYYALNLGLTSMAFGLIIRCLVDFTL